MRAGGPEIDGGLCLAEPSELGGVRRFSHPAMATVFEVHAVHPDPGYAAQAAQATFALVDRLEGELSRFASNSDIARINLLEAGQSVPVGRPAIECLLIAGHLFDLTGGAFDISIGTGLRSLEIDADNCRVHSTKDGVRVDLGGIGKGYAVDLMAEVLEEWGIERALVHGGFSSVLALDAAAEREGWPLTLSDPAAPSRVLARLSVRQTALGASGRRKGDHIVDPRTGTPVRGRLAAWVALPRPPRSGAGADDGPRLAAGAVTDALTTAFMLLSPEEITALCETSPGLEAWILPDAAGSQSDETGLLHFRSESQGAPSSGPVTAGDD
jgi:thiamine biosynthesis lipoprotein